MKASPPQELDVGVSTLEPHSAKYGAVNSRSAGQTTVSITHAWITTIPVCFNIGLNAFMCLNFSSVEVIAQRVFAVSSQAVGDLFSMFFLLMALGMAVGLWMNDNCERVSLTLCVVANVSAALIRWYSLHIRSYGLCMFSVVLSAYAACSLLPLPSQLAHRRFPPHLRALVTNLILQSSCLGELLGAVVPAFRVDTAESFITFAWWQALASVFIGISFFALYSPQNSTNEFADDYNPSTMSGFVDIFKALTGQPKFALSVASHGILGGIGWAFPSAVFFILEGQQTGSDLLEASMSGAVCNIAFTGAGVVSGVILSSWCQDGRRFTPVLFACYLLCSLSFVFLANSSLLNISNMLFFVGVAGATSVGFLGIAVEATCSTEGVRANYVDWAIMLAVSGSTSFLQHLSAERNDVLIFLFAALTATVMFTATLLL